MSTPTAAPRPNLLSLDDALARLLGAIEPLPAAERERLSTFDALGRVLAEDVRSALDVPPEDNSAMDGYALRAADVPSSGTVLPVSQRIPAGVVGQPLAAGTAARIFTGAQVPKGADTVVMQELCEAVDGGAVRINTVPERGGSVRLRGEDVQNGAVVLPAGVRLLPQHLGLAAAVGAATVRVGRRPKVALFSTGDELVMPGEPLKPGAIYNSNRYTLTGLIRALGGECVDLGIVPDKLDLTRAVLREAAAGNDLIVSCGGVSVGEEDHLKPAVEAEGRLDLWQIALKPGKPLAFGEVRRPSGEGSAWFIGLPGNPVSAYITFMLAVRPVLLKLQGGTNLAPVGYALRADFDWAKPDRRREFMRVRLNAEGGLDLYPNQGSGVLTSVVWGDGLVDNPPGQAIRRGDTVRFLPFAALLA
jgi:molybdopterin molybdotransferase